MKYYKAIKQNEVELYAWHWNLTVIYYRFIWKSKLLVNVLKSFLSVYA